MGSRGGSIPLSLRGQGEISMAQSLGPGPTLLPPWAWTPGSPHTAAWLHLVPSVPPCMNGGKAKLPSEVQET